ncbi:MAG TPA: trypsin-like peptidase domain-containing protein [Polyangia bacterium]|nr:trypsin-like peptidase domain-containing protein [Polyangia bacterium]
MRRLSLVAAAAALALLALALAPAASRADEPLWTEGHPAAKVTATPAAVRPDFVKLSESLAPAVVYIAGRVGGSSSGGLGRRFESDPSGKSVGTGFIINKNGYILTNFHVVERTDEIRVKLADGRDFYAQVIGSDEKTDVALLKIEAPQPLPVAPLGDSDRLRVGEWVIAIGNPYGEFERSVTAGIISAVGRNNVKPTGKEELYANFIQTDAAINLGNSGGPLINSGGEVVGIASAIYRRPGTPDYHDAQNISFAIPINMAKHLLPLLVKYGRAPRSKLGIDIQAVTVYLARAFKLARPEGALVARVAAGSPGDKAGLHAGDVIIEFNGRRVSNHNDLPWFASTTPAGERVPIVIVRDGAERKLSVVMVPDPDDKPARTRERPVHAAAARTGDPIGITVMELTPQLAAERGLAGTQGVVVTDLIEGSPAVEAGVERDDVVVRVGKTEVASAADYRRALEGITRGSTVLLLLKREGHPFWVAFPKR